MINDVNLASFVKKDADGVVAYEGVGDVEGCGLDRGRRGFL